MLSVDSWKDKEMADSPSWSLWLKKCTKMKSETQSWSWNSDFVHVTETVIAMNSGWLETWRAQQLDSVDLLLQLAHTNTSECEVMKQLIKTFLLHRILQLDLCTENVNDGLPGEETQFLVD